MNLNAIRDYFPVVDSANYLNNAAESPLCLPVRDRLDAYLDIMAAKPYAKPSPRDETRTALARLLGGSPEEYALVPSTGVGIGIAAAGFPWKPGDNVVIPAGEHWNNIFPWLALKERGVELRVAPEGSDHRVAIDDIAKLMDSRTRLLAAAAVRFDNGHRAALRALSALAHDKKALFLVDCIQGAGIVPIDMEDDGIDIASAAAFKWLLGLPGSGFLYVKKNHWDLIKPVLPGMFAAEDSFSEVRFLPDARRYETGTIAYSHYHAWAAGLEILMATGIAAVQARVMRLTERLIEGLRSRGGIELLSPVDRESDRSAILSFSLGSTTANKALVEGLAGRDIIIALRGGNCRVSPNFFNAEHEIDELLKALDHLPRAS